jgi:acyl-CoA synthetase (AMP-forming)/AMP-acid ligase II
VFPPVASSLSDVMRDYAGDASASVGMYFWNTASRGYDHVSYAELVQRSFAFGVRVLRVGHTPDRVCLIACHSPYATLVAFYGAISVGVIPMIFPMPRALGSSQALLERINHWGLKFDRPAILVLEEGVKEKFHEEIPAQIPVIRLSDSPLGHWDLLPGPAVEQSPGRDDVAFFQTTSSSTGDHKAVAISHGNILSNVSGIRAAVDMKVNERMISWLPLFHDMGLVGTVLFSFCNRYPLYIMTPTQFIKRPALWLRGMSEHRCTIATAPNFGYDYCSRISARDTAEFDLTGVKHFFIGAEPIRVSTIRNFCAKFESCGVRPGMIRPAYGLAESTIITTISRPHTRARFVFLDPGSIGMNQLARVVAQAGFDDSQPEQPLGEKLVAACTAGVPIEGMRVELVDEDGSPVTAERCAGEIVIQGDSVALGYVNGAHRLIDRFDRQRVGTGDMGVMLDGELFIIERIKNIIIRNGENFLVSTLEQRLSEILGVSHDNIAVFESNIHDPSSEIVVLIEKHKGLSAEQIDPLLARLPQEGFPIDLILFSRTRAIPRTTSGKKRHFICRKHYQNDALEFQSSIEVTPDRIAGASTGCE